MYGRNGGGGGNLYSNGGAITTGRFYHLAMTYNGSTATAYLNGVATQTGVNIERTGLTVLTVHLAFYLTRRHLALIDYFLMGA